MRDVGAHLTELLGENFGRPVIFQDRLLQNSRLVFRTHNSEDANIVKDMLTDRFNMKPYLIKQTPVFAMLEQSPERRERSATIAKANGLLEDAIGSSDHIRLDVRAGSSYFAPSVDDDRGLKIVGDYNAARKTWTWSAEALHAAWPTLDVEELKKNTERILNLWRRPGLSRRTVGGMFLAVPHPFCLVNWNVDKFNARLLSNLLDDFGSNYHWDVVIFKS